MQSTYLFVAATILTSILPGVVLAEDYGLGDTAAAAGLSSYGGSLQGAIGTVVGSLLSLIGIIFFIMVIYGGIMWMTSAGNQETVKKSINTVISASIGIVVVLSAYAITNFVLSSVGTGGSSPAPSGSTSNNPGQSDECTAQRGTCMDRSNCTGGRSVPGICPGGTNWQCCVPTDPSEETESLPPPSGSGQARNDASCTAGPQCVSGFCDPVLETCQDRPPAAPGLRTGEPCTANNECDSGDCIPIPGLNPGNFNVCR